MSENQTPPPIQVSPNEMRMWNMLCHLSGLIGFFLPFGNSLGPLLICRIKKQQIPSVNVHGKAALNFQLTVTVIDLFATILALVCSRFLPLALSVLILGVGMLIWILGLIFAIIAGVMANDVKNFRYPFSFQFVK